MHGKAETREKNNRVIPLICTACTKVWMCGFNLLLVWWKLWIVLPPYHPTFPIILTMNLISLVNTDIAPGQQSRVPHSTEIFTWRVSHSHSLQPADRFKWSSTTMICVFFTFSGAGFLYLLVAVFTDTPLVIYWRKNVIRKLNVINQRCLFLAHLIFTKMKLVFIVQSLVSVTFFTEIWQVLKNAIRKSYLKYAEKRYYFCGWETRTISRSMSQFLRI